MAMQIGILGAGKIGTSIATLLETAEFVDAVFLVTIPQGAKSMRCTDSAHL